jgi:hypothetical protein
VLSANTDVSRSDISSEASGRGVRGCPSARQPFADRLGPPLRSSSADGHVKSRDAVLPLTLLFTEPGVSWMSAPQNACRIPSVRVAHDTLPVCVEAPLT